MRVTIAIIAVLVVGSNAGLLDGLLNPVIGILNPSAAVTSANTLLNSLQSQIRAIQDSASVDIRSEFQIVSDRIVVLQNSALVIAQRLQVQGATGATDLVSNLQGVIQSVLQLVRDLLNSLLGGLLGIVIVAPERTDLLSQINRIFINLRSQIDGIVKPLIQTLNTNIGSGKVNISCFNNEIPEIQGNITVVVQKVRDAYDAELCRVTHRVDEIVASINGRVSGLQTNVTACGTDLDCQVRLVSFRL